MADTPCVERLPAGSAGTFQSLATLMHILADTVPPRTAVRQIEALFVVAYAHAMGRSVTMTDVIEAVDDEGGARALERSLHVFVAPNRIYPDALDWVEQVLDDEDRRKKYLRLTPEGVRALGRALAAMRGEKPAVAPNQPRPLRKSEPVVPSRLSQKPSGIWRVDFTDPITGKRHRVSCGTRDRGRANLAARKIIFDTVTSSARRNA